MAQGDNSEIRGELSKIGDRLLTLISDTRANTDAVVRLTKDMHGNGQPGLMSRFQEVEANQKHCQALQRGVAKHWKDAIFIIAVLALFFRDTLEKYL